MNKFESHTRANTKGSSKYKADRKILTKMVKGYKEMAEINLSLSKMYFEVESEVDSYYEYIAESE